MLSAHGPFLRSIRLKSITDELVESLKYCVSLEEFKYLDIPSQALLDALPSTLEHLQIQNGTAKHVSIDHVIEYIAEANHRLRVLTYNSCGSPTHREFVRLRDSCRQRGIVLKCFGDNAPLEEVSHMRVAPHHDIDVLSLCRENHSFSRSGSPVLHPSHPNVVLSQSRTFPKHSPFVPGRVSNDQQVKLYTLPELCKLPHSHFTPYSPTHIPSFYID